MKSVPYDLILKNQIRNSTLSLIHNFIPYFLNNNFINHRENYEKECFGTYPNYYRSDPDGESIFIGVRWVILCNVGFFWTIRMKWRPNRKKSITLERPVLFICRHFEERYENNFQHPKIYYGTSPAIDDFTSVVCIRGLVNHKKRPNLFWIKNVMFKYFTPKYG